MEKIVNFYKESRANLTIDVYHSMSIGELYHLFKDGDLECLINLDKPLSERQQLETIENILSGIPAQNILIHITKKGIWVAEDHALDAGAQRLKIFFDFLDGNLKLKASDFPKDFIRDYFRREKITLGVTSIATSRIVADRIDFMRNKLDKMQRRR